LSPPCSVFGDPVYEKAVKSSCLRGTQALNYFPKAKAIVVVILQPTTPSLTRLVVLPLKILLVMFSLEPQLPQSALVFAIVAPSP
jgi:hypothetical protein